MLLVHQSSACSRRLWLKQKCMPTQPTIVLVGNSFTSMNHMPKLLQHLIGNKYKVLDASHSGFPLMGHEHRHDLTKLLQSNVTKHVILQEQSYFLSKQPSFYNMYTTPSVARLRDLSNATTYLMQTWGYFGGLYPHDTFKQMNDRLRKGTRDVAQRTGLTVIPIGDTWEDAYAEMSDADFRHEMFARDGRHPSMKSAVWNAITVMKYVVPQIKPQYSEYVSRKFGMTELEFEMIKSIINNP